jgi:hypothetical protein
MANDMFTTRSGKQIPIPEIRLPKDVVTSAMRLREDYAMKGQSYSLTGVILEMLSKGNDTIRAHWKAAAKNKELRDTGKAVKEYIRIQLVLRKPIDPIEVARLSGMQVPEGNNEPVELDTLVETEITDEELDAATSPTGTVS